VGTPRDLVLAYTVDPDAAISLDVCSTLTVMDGMLYPHAGAGSVLLLAAVMQMLADFRCRPGGCHEGRARLPA